MHKLQSHEIFLGMWINVPRKDQCPFRVDLIEHHTQDYAKVGMYPDGRLDKHPLTWDLHDLTRIELTREILERCGWDRAFEDVEEEGDGKLEVYYPRSTPYRDFRVRIIPLSEMQEDMEDASLQLKDVRKEYFFIETLIAGEDGEDDFWIVHSDVRFFDKFQLIMTNIFLYNVEFIPGDIDTFESQGVKIKKFAKVIKINRDGKD